MGRNKKPTLEQTPEALTTPNAVMPEAPSYLNRDALAEWNRMAQYLFDIGKLTFVDQSALAMWCINVSRLIEVEAEISANGIVFMANSGYPIQSPYLNISIACQKNLLLLAKEFGFSPAARAKLVGETKQHVDNKLLNFVKANA